MRTIKILFAMTMMMIGISAQSENVITMISNKNVGDSIWLGFKANGNYALTGVSGKYEETGSHYALTSDTITLTGEIKSLNAHDDGLIKIDVSGDTALTTLICTNNDLTQLDVSKNTKMDWLDFSHNKLTSIDVANDTALTVLDCSYNKLTKLDVSNNHHLEFIYCYSNLISETNMSVLVNSLVNRQGDDEGTIVVVNTDGDTNVCNTDQVAIAKGKNWNVESSNNEDAFSDYAGSPVSGTERIADDVNATIVGVYDVNGIQIAKMQRGLNIIKMSDGKVRKVFVKE
jgi:hypothetical protein